MKRFLPAAIIIITAAFFSACQKNATFNEQVSINGNVSYGAVDPATGLVKVTGAANNATVSCTGFSETAKTGSDGNYTLSINTTRSFSAPNADAFSLNASWQGNSKTVTVYAKPGDTVKAGDIVISK